MPKVHRKPPAEHLVVVDTNILWDKDKKLPVSPLFDTFWAKNSVLLPMTLQVPALVLGELHFQQTTSALKSLATITDAYAELSGITAIQYRHKCNESAIRTQVKAKLDRWLKQTNGIELPTPVTDINWGSIVEAAVWRQPPFTFDPKEQKNEKGFRDAIILETVIHACGSATTGTVVIFVCNDYLLRTTAEARLKSSEKFLAFESLQDFESYIHLSQQQLTNEFVKSIQSHARSKFFTKNDPNCIVIKHDILTRIIKDFTQDLEFKDPTKNALSFLAQAIGTNALTAKLVSQKFLVRSTQFAALQGTREFQWTSRVDAARLFEIDKSGAGIIESALPPIRRIQVVGFDIRWKANVKADGRFHDIEVTSINKVESQSYDATEEMMEKLLLSLPT